MRASFVYSEINKAQATVSTDQLRNQSNKKKSPGISRGCLFRCPYDTSRVRRKQVDFSQHPLNNQLAIGNRNKLINPIGNSQLEVDKLLELYSGLIDTDYKKWFAKRFYKLSPEVVARCASEARADGKDPRKLFCKLVIKHSS